jgi:diguanylate cyclase (GGDEF)-like protein/PAS domain S-box-containing protein
MLRIVGCITQQHDLWLVALAACICALACGTTINLLAGIRTQKQHSPVAHLLTASVVFGCGVWSLHFVAMLAFASPIPIAYGIAMTFGSVLIAIAGTLSALLIWQFSPSRLSRVVIGGGLLGLSISAMHFCGVLAMQVTGTVHLDSSEVGLSVAVAVVFSIVALARFEGLPLYWRRIETIAWLSLAICGLHFTAMTGLSLEPGLARNSQAAILGSGGLAIAIGSFSVAILIVGLAATIMEQHLSQRAGMELRRIQMLSDLSQEILVICRNGVILQMNTAGVRTFGPRHLVGTRILDLVLNDDQPVVARHMGDSGIDSGDQEVHLYAANGSVLTAEISCRVIDYEGAPAIAVAFRDLTDRKRDEARIRHLAHHDALTDLPNRFLLQERLTHAVDAAGRSMTHIAVLCLDLDRFKPVNDLFGHGAGDALLVEVARRLQAEVRSGDTIARMGGDEFVIVAGFDQPENLALLAERLLDATRKPFMLDAGQVGIGASIGIACYPGDAPD